MANENEPEPEVIRKQMEETRTSLTEKLEALESQVTETVKTVTDAVSEATENVKETVETVTEGVKETVETVAETFSLRTQMQRRPWVVMGGSVAVGCMLGYMLTPRRRHYREETHWAPPSSIPETRTPVASSFTSSGLSAEPQQRPPELPRSPQPGMFSWLGEQLGHLKGLAIGTLMGTIRDLVARQLPEGVAPRFTEEIDNMTRRMGGEPIHGSLLPEGESSGGSEHQQKGGNGNPGSTQPSNPASEGGRQSHEERTGPRW
jgi:ElaB/YqjD/DUF883 family membrane-anchored ribosome-binding protein